MSDCCKNEAQFDLNYDLFLCQKCGSKGNLVHRITVENLLVDDAKVCLGLANFNFCSNSSCDVVYFSNEENNYFYKSDLKVRVGLKETQEPIPVCYCFNYTRMNILSDIANNNKSTIEIDIKNKIKSGLCSCEIKNPQGKCCLGNVAEIIKLGLDSLVD